MSESSPTEYLLALGRMGDGPHDVAEAALMLAALDHPDRPLTPYRAHLTEIVERARGGTGHAREAEAVGRGLTQLFVGHFGYEGDRWRFDDPQNADFMQVIDRRRGLPVALGILYMHGARAAGFAAQGLYAPGHFLLLISAEDSEALVDPFNGSVSPGREHLGGPPGLVNPALAADPRSLLPVSDADVLLRLQTNVKNRAFEAGDPARAAQIAERMLMIAPNRADIWYEFAKLKENAGGPRAARAALESCLALAKPGESLHNEAALALSALKRQLN